MHFHIYLHTSDLEHPPKVHANSHEGSSFIDVELLDFQVMAFLCELFYRFIRWSYCLDP